MSVFDPRFILELGRNAARELRERVHAPPPCDYAHVTLRGETVLLLLLLGLWLLGVLWTGGSPLRHTKQKPAPSSSSGTSQQGRRTFGRR